MLSEEYMLVCAMQRMLAYVHMRDGYGPLPHRRLPISKLERAVQWAMFNVAVQDEHRS